MDHMRRARHRRFSAAIVLATLCLTPLPVCATDFYYSDWMASSDQWQRGWAFSFIQHLSNVVLPDEAPKYETTQHWANCFTGKMTDLLMALAITNYPTRHPETRTQPVIQIAFAAAAEFCGKPPRWK